MRIHIAYADFYQEYNTSVWRCFIPGKALERRGHEVTYSHYHDILKHDADTYLVERNLQDPNLIESVSRLRKSGKRIVVTFDDAYQLMPDYSISKSSWNRDSLARFNRSLRLVDCAIVPSKLLLQDYKNKCKDIRYIPNYADSNLYPKKKQHQTFNILWGGNATHLHSVKESGLLSSLGKIVTAHGNVGVIVVSGDPMVRLAFQNEIPEGRIMVFPWMPLVEWTGVVAEYADLIVCPLQGEYDRRRSWVKAIDAVMYGLPMVATRLDPYLETGALLVENGQWYNALSDIILSPMRRNSIVRRMKEKLGDVTIDAHIEEYENVLRG